MGPDRRPFRSRRCARLRGGLEPCVPGCARSHLALQSQTLFVSLSTPSDLLEPALPLFPRVSPPTRSLRTAAPLLRAPPAPLWLGVRDPSGPVPGGSPHH